LPVRPFPPERHHADRRRSLLVEASGRPCRAEIAAPATMLRMATRAGAAVCIVLLSAAVTSTVQLRLDAQSILDAIAVGQASVESQRARFHAAYRIGVGQTPVDYIEVVTPFRRVAVEAERRARTGDRRFGQRQALEWLEAQGDGVELWLELTFHPLHTFVRVPDYGVAVHAPGGAAVEARTTAQVPRHGARIERLPTREVIAAPTRLEPLVGGTLIVELDGISDARATYTVVVSESGTELARASIPFGRMR
jgi:hypothetical protein